MIHRKPSAPSATTQENSAVSKSPKAFIPEGHHCLDLGERHGRKYELSLLLNKKWVHVYVRPNGGAELASDLKDLSVMDRDDRAMAAEQDQYNDRIDGLESLLLALAAEGFNVGSPEFIKAIDTALDAIANH